MNSVSHITALELRHQTLKQQIIQETRNRTLDDLKLRELKRKKLELKDEIKRLELGIRH